MCGFLGDDFTSMAHSLELRVPLVDWQIFDLAGRLPGVYKLDLLGGKRVLRSAFDDLLPLWIRRDQRKKTFTLPLMKWLRHSLWAARVYDVLVTPQALLTQWLDPKAVQKVVEALLPLLRHHQARLAPGPASVDAADSGVMAATTTGKVPELG